MTKLKWRGHPPHDAAGYADVVASVASDWGIWPRVAEANAEVMLDQRVRVTIETVPSSGASSFRHTPAQRQALERRCGTFTVHVGGAAQLREELVRHFRA
jgi:hypothetical protein